MDNREEKSGPQISENLAQLLNEIGSDPRDLDNMILSDNDYTRLEELGEEYMTARTGKQDETMWPRIAEAKSAAGRILTNAPAKGV